MYKKINEQFKGFFPTKITLPFLNIICYYKQHIAINLSMLSNIVLYREPLGTSTKKPCKNICVCFFNLTGKVLSL